MAIHRHAMIALLALAAAACGSSEANPDSGAARDTTRPPAKDSGTKPADQTAAGDKAAASDTAVAAAKVGGACTAATTCPKGGSGIGKCDTSWPGGYCVIDGCDGDAHDCPGDPGMGQVKVGESKCVLAPTPMCLLACATGGDCRAEYQCTAKPDGMGHGDVKVCIPK